MRVQYGTSSYPLQHVARPWLQTLDPPTNLQNSALVRKGKYTTKPVYQALGASMNSFRDSCSSHLL